MTDATTDPARPQVHPPDTAADLRRPDRPRSAGLFRAVWRWHFFASFLVIPVLLLLAVTGLIYLFRFQLEPLLHPDLMRVDPPADAGPAAMQPYLNQQAAVVMHDRDATIVSMTEPADVDDPTVFSTVLPDGSARDVFVDPYTAEVLGSLNPDTTVSGTAVRLHADAMSGVVGDRVIEIGACWALVMAGTGYYLLVKGRRARRRQRASGRPGARLRSTHGAIGSVAGVGLLALLVTGLPWTGFWGAHVQSLLTGAGTSMWSTDPGAASDPTSTLDESLPHSHLVPWALGDTEVPRSDPSSAPSSGGERNVANLDTAVLVADQEGLRHPMTVSVPADDDDGAVYSVIGYAFDAPSDERTVHVDKFGGDVVSSYGYDDYPALAKVVAQGIGLHEGRSVGLWSFWGSALMCLAIIAMCVTGPVMWWRRRPRGRERLGAPRGRMPLRSGAGLAVGLVAVGLLLPMFGATLAAVLLLDQLVLRRVPALAGWFDVT